MVNVNGINLFYRDVGFGPPVVLLHGYGQSNRVFRSLEEYLLLNHRIILIDSRGHGQSEHGRSPISISLMAKDVAAAMDALGVEQAAIIGFSDGGNIALQMAVDFPELVSSIVAISGNARPDGLSKYYIRLLRALRRVLTVFRADTDMMNLLLAQPRITNAELAGITTPTLLIYGSRDLVARTHMKELNRLIPASRLIIVKGVRHTNIVKKWRKYIEDAERFINTKTK